MQDSEDTDLLREYVDRNSEEAFAVIVARHVNKVYSTALRHTGNPHSAEEITQAVFIILARKSRHLGRRVNLSGWLYQTARLTAVTFIRSEIRRSRREQETHMQTITNEEESDIWPEIAPLLDAAVAGLNETDRHAVVLRYFDGKSMKEVGAALGVNEDAAKKRVNRALEKLRKFFVKRGVDFPTANIAEAISTNSVQAAPVALAKFAVGAAITKGAAASNSTLALIKGALKFMAWTKAKPAIVIGTVMLFAVGTAVVAERRPDGMEYKGTLTLAFPMAPNGPQTNIYDVCLWSKPPYWQLSLTSSNHDHQVYGSPRQTFEVDVYDNPPTGPLNTASIKIFPGARPLDDRTAEHVWLALLSGKLFANRKLPLQDPGIGMAEPSTILEVNGTSQDTSPRQMRWNNEFPNGRSSRIEGEFKWLASTNTLDGLNVPTASRMAMYLVNSEGERRLFSFSELTIASIDASSVKPIRIPQIPGRNVVYDYRLGDFLMLGWNTKPKQYDVIDGKGLDKMP